VQELREDWRQVRAFLTTTDFAEADIFKSASKVLWCHFTYNLSFRSHIYIYIYMCVCVCVCVCIYIISCVCLCIYIYI
jgi:hypothetical protein